jgi:hypothetical protein
MRVPLCRWALKLAMVMGGLHHSMSVFTDDLVDHAQCCFLSYFVGLQGRVIEVSRPAYSSALLYSSLCSLVVSLIGSVLLHVSVDICESAAFSSRAGGLVYGSSFVLRDARNASAIQHFTMYNTSSHDLLLSPPRRPSCSLGIGSSHFHVVLAKVKQMGIQSSNQVPPTLKRTPCFVMYIVAPSRRRLRTGSCWSAPNRAWQYLATSVICLIVH